MWMLQEEECREIIKAIINFRYGIHDPDLKRRIHITNHGGIATIYFLGDPVELLTIAMKDGTGCCLQKAELEKLCSEDLQQIHDYFLKRRKKKNEDGIESQGEKFTYLTEI